MSQFSFEELKAHWRPLVLIAMTVGMLALAFAWASGWLGSRLTAQDIISQMVANNSAPLQPGFRRAHAKGQCFSGTFRASGAAADLSTARLFSQSQTAVIGRFSIGHGDPHAPDSATRTTSIALLAKTDDGQQWRMAMNSIPYFATSRPEGFWQMLRAFRPDPATGKPDPTRVAAFRAAWPESEKLSRWLAEAAWADSYANSQVNSIHSFGLVAADGAVRYMRWTMRPQTPFRGLTAEQREHADHDFLSKNLQASLERGPVRFDMVMSLAEPGDPIDDPSQPWPEERTRVVAGTLEVIALHDQATGLCRDINFDPTIVPSGIVISNDPVLAARSSTYSQSFNARMREIGRGQATEAIGKEESP